MKGAKWTEEQCCRLRNLLDDGGTDREIALAMGRSRMAIVRQRCNMGIKRNTKLPWTDDEKNVLISNASTLSSREIATLLGRTQKAINWKKWELELTGRVKCPNCGKVFHGDGNRCSTERSEGMG